jgi:hypothetical protein
MLSRLSPSFVSRLDDTLEGPAGSLELYHSHLPWFEYGLRLLHFPVNVSFLFGFLVSIGERARDVLIASGQLFIFVAGAFLVFAWGGIGWSICHGAP